MTSPTKLLVTAALVLLLCHTPDVAAIRQHHRHLQQATETIAEIASNNPNTTTLYKAVGAAGLAETLSSTNATFTVFAPVDSAFAKRLNSTTCVDTYQVAQNCASLDELLSSLNLPTLLLNHVVGGTFSSSNLTSGMTIQGMGQATQVVTSNSSGVYIGAAKVIMANIAATNGIIHLIDDVLAYNVSTDSSFNTTSIQLYLKNFADLGPGLVNEIAFTTANLTQMVADDRSIIGYSRTFRPVVAKTNGGWTYPMPLTFDATMGNKPCAKTDPADAKWEYPMLDNVTLPDNEEDIAFMTILELAALIRTKQISSVNLTQLYLRRLRKYDNVLQPTVTFTEELAMNQSMAADALLANGTYLGPLHGIPYGLKDLCAVPPYRTTWGSGAFIDQYIPYDSFVYQQLTKAGAVLVAKLVSGEMAQASQWWGGNTRCPWNIAVSASGSSAGPGSAVSAGLVAFGIGTETSGSIVSPSNTNGLTGIRPTNGVNGRSYCMALSQTYDKLGPLARSVMDAAIVLDAIRGKDPNDVDTCNFHLPNPFNMSVSGMTVGMVSTPNFNMSSPYVQEVIANFTALGVNIVPMNMTFPIPLSQAGAVQSATFAVETAAYFDDWLRSGRVINNTVQTSWPVTVKRARMVPAVEYIQATRLRGECINAYLKNTENVDAWISDAASTWTAIGNVANFPEVVVPYGFIPATTPANYTASTPRKLPQCLGIFGRPYEESKLIALGMAFQTLNKANKLRPPIDQVEPAILNSCPAGQGLRCEIEKTNPSILLKLNETGIGLTPTLYM